MRTLSKVYCIKASSISINTIPKSEETENGFRCRPSITSSRFLYCQLSKDLWLNQGRERRRLDEEVADWWDSWQGQAESRCCSLVVSARRCKVTGHHCAVLLLNTTVSVTVKYDQSAFRTLETADDLLHCTITTPIPPHFCKLQLLSNSVHFHFIDRSQGLITAIVQMG